MQLIKDINKPKNKFKNSLENHLIFLKGFSTNSKLINEKIINIIKIIGIVVFDIPNDHLKRLMTPSAKDRLNMTYDQNK